LKETLGSSNKKKKITVFYIYNNYFFQNQLFFFYYLLIDGNYVFSDGIKGFDVAMKALRYREIPSPMNELIFN